jgi:plastocyanin
MGQATWTVPLVNGTYRFVCDVHPVQMNGSFTVGTAPPPPPPSPPPPPPPTVTRLRASVGPGARIALRNAGGSRVTRLRAGRYSIAVTDATTADNFHLTGPGLNRKTGVAFRGRATWRVTLRRGTYRFRSDRHPALKGAVRVS